LKCDGTRTETRFLLSVKRTNPFKSVVAQFSRLLAAEVCASAVVMLDTPCSEVVWRVLATHSIRQFPLHSPSCASPCAITFQLDSTSHEVSAWPLVSFLPHWRISSIGFLDPMKPEPNCGLIVTGLVRGVENVPTNRVTKRQTDRTPSTHKHTQRRTSLAF